MFSKLNSYVDRGLLRRQVSPCGRLCLYDYTEKCTYEKVWDEVTLNHRGTVYEIATGNIVARAFPKFFNFSELSAAEQAEKLRSRDFRVFTKLDGSLGIIYYYYGWRVNTRGSFSSDQAIEATKMLDSMDTSKLVKDKTYLVEIIYPENRIVVDYNGMRDLVLLGVVNTQTGQEYDISTEISPFEKEAPTCIYNSISEVLAKLKTLPFNQEGYVVQFVDGSRAKFKGDEYIEMHRLISGVSPLAIWENMEAGVVPEEFLAKIPEEFRDRYSDIAVQLEDSFSELLAAVEMRVQDVLDDVLKAGDPTELRKKVGLYLKDNEHPLNQFVFPTVLGKHDVVVKLAMKEIRPHGNHL